MSRLARLVDPKILRLLSILRDGKIYHLTQLSKDANVAPATTMRLLKTLEEHEFVAVTIAGKIKLYSMPVAVREELEGELP